MKSHRALGDIATRAKRRTGVKTMRELQCIWPVAAKLGEGPIWSDREKALYFVDILGRSIHRWQENIETRSWTTPAEPGFVLPCYSGGLICGLRGGLYHFDPASGTFTFLVPVEQERPERRINDGFADASGRVWFGTMNEDCKTVGGALYSLGKDNSLRIHDTGYTVPNGPAVS